MDIWRYFEITHAQHEVMNPMSGEQLDTLGQALRLREGQRVLDVGCGHAEALIRWRAAHHITGVGLDASPYHSARGRRRVEERGMEGALEIHHARGETHVTDERFDVVVCMGATWIWGGYEGTLKQLAAWAKPGGAVVVGEPYWMAPPPEAYLDLEGLSRSDFHELGWCHERALSRGLELIWMARASPADWDRYEIQQATAVDVFLQDHPDDPDAATLREKRRTHDEAYLRWGHRCFGWALWAFRVTADAA